MISALLIRLPGTVVLAFLLVLCAGCGLADYEAQLETQQKRLKYIEDENEILDKDVTLGDEDKEDVVTSAEFYFRPPKGVKPEAEPKLLGKLFYVYPSQRTDSGFKDVLLAVVPEGKVVPAKFQKDIKDFLEIKGQGTVREYARPRNMPNSFPQRFNVYEEGKTVLCFLEDPTFPTAIAFRLSGAKSPIIEDRIKFSLASVLEGKFASSQRKLARGSAAKKVTKTKKGSEK